MKCEIIQDLLPSYIENLTSEESNKEIKNHLSDCEECKKVYQEMTAEVGGIPKADTDGAKLFKKVKKNLFLQRVGMLLLILILLTAGIFLYKHSDLKPGILYAELPDRNVTALYELENGDIYLEVIMPQNINRFRIEDPTVDENYQLTKDYEQDFEASLVFYSTLWNRILYVDHNRPAEGHPVIIKRGNLIEREGTTASFEAISSGRKNSKEYKVIWKEGDPIEKAPADIEQKAKEFGD